MAKRNRLRSSSARKGTFTRNLLLLLAVLVLGGAAAGAFLLFETESPVLTLNNATPYIGASVIMPLEASDQRSGIRSIQVRLVQNDSETVLLERTFERQSWLKQAGPQRVAETVAVDTSSLGVQDGDGELVATARDFSLMGFLKGNITEHRTSVVIDTKPPVVTVEHAQLYIRPGGSGIVLYSVSEPSALHGVQINERHYPGFPLEEGGRTQIAYVGLPWNTEAVRDSRVIAMDEAGNEGVAPFSMNFKPVKDKLDRINISDGFLNKKIPEFEAHAPEATGSMLDKFLHANRQVRTENAEQILTLCANPEQNKLWQDRFLRMPGATRAGFADQRTYYYQGQAIDNQTHLGIDIASTERAEIRAANRGKVIFADYLGIYGNMVLLDHGQGLFSLYSHLSSIQTEVGALVEKDEQLGRSGATGMAGGDHLHFSMLVHGIFVNPIEWWDQHWIDVNINGIIGGRSL